MLSTCIAIARNKVSVVLIRQNVFMQSWWKVVWSRGNRDGEVVARSLQEHTGVSIDGFKETFHDRYITLGLLHQLWLSAIGHYSLADNSCELV